MMSSKFPDLSQLFGAVTGVLGENKEVLNQEDDYNHNHGDNMVEIFRVITQAMEEKKDAAPADQLEYASVLLRDKTSGGSAKVYSNGLAKAAQQFQGRQLNQNSAMELITALMGASQEDEPADTSQDPLNGMIGTFLSGLVGGEATGQKKSGLDASDLLKVGMAFMQARQQGSDPMAALVDVMVTNSPMGSSRHRSDSGKMVANTLLQMIGSMGGK